MSEEDDWFERALRDLDEESESSGSDDETDETDHAETAGDGETGATDDDSEPVDDDSGPVDTDPFGGSRDGKIDSSPGGGERDTADREEPPSGGSGPSVDSDAFGSGTFGQEAPAGDGPSEDGDPFGDDRDDGTGTFGDDDPFGGGSAGGAGMFGDEDPFAEERGGRPQTSESDSPDDGGSADPFGGYRNTSPGGEFGFDDVDGGDSTGFDVDLGEFESAIERTDIGIEGLDEMILGGVPQRSLLSVIGGAGTGKTTFALQFLNEALASGRNGVYITLEQTRESIFATSEEKGWSFREHAEADRLAVVAIDPVEMANSLASIRNDLTRLIAEFDADRLVLDSVSLLEMMYDHPAKRRSEVFGFTRSLKNAGVTTLLTSEASETNPYASRHGIVEYLTDAVFVLQYVRGSDFRETRLAVEIQKIRDANHSREMKPYDITESGISVYDRANIF